MASPIVTGRPAVRGREAGFTLLGLLFLVAGLGVGLAALGTVWHTVVQREREQELLFVGNQYRRAIEQYWRQSPGGVRQLPKTLEELLADPRFPTTVRHLRRLYRDPMTGKPEWGLITEPDGGISGVYSLGEGEPLKRSGFAPDDQRFMDASSYQAWAFRFDVERAAREGQAPVPAQKDGAPAPAPP